MTTTRLKIKNPCNMRAVVKQFGYSIAVGDWRLRLIELRNSFERISFFSVYELVYRSVSPQEAVTSTKLLKEA
jgi:hypothetical protein